MMHTYEGIFSKIGVKSFSIAWSPKTVAKAHENYW